jgi:DNA-binding transcriptional ArsR family regulator
MSGPADKVKSELKGTTLRVYWVLLKKGSGGTGPREVMRELGLSSPSVASYHLEKLRNLGLVERDVGGNYVGKEEVKVEVFSDFVRVVGMMLPRYLFYSVLFTTMLVAYVVLYPLQFTPQTIMVLIFGLTSCIITWVETVRAWRRRPF